MGTAWKAVATDQPPDWHQAKFKEFVALKQQVGEPSPHMALAGFLTQQDNAQWNEVVWRAGVYGAPYSVLTSEAIWREWPWERMRHANRSEFRAWVERNWGGFHIRTERRMVRTPEKMTTNLLSYADWLRSGQPHGILQSQHLYSPRENYDRWYVAVEQNVMYFGRYITIRVVEFLRRFAGADAELYDIRSIGGESPVRCLSLLYPDHSVALLEHKSRQIADSLAERLLHSVQQTQPHVNHYVLAAMLCEYREAYEDRHQYPGRTIDQELAYLTGSKARWWEDRGFSTRLWEARAELFPAASLGELQGWSGVRHDLSRWLRDRGQNWSDLKYDYVT